MTEDNYIRHIVAKYRKSSASLNNAYSTAKKLYPLIIKWAKPHLLKIEPTGSFKKGTGIKGTTDIDLLISLSPKTPYSLNQIYYSLSKYLENNGLIIREQNVSIRVTYYDVSIDLVPAKRQPNSTYDHSIFLRKSDTWIKTNVHKHIVLIRKSGCSNEIRAIKIWRDLHGLDFSSFYLELSVLESLRRKKKPRISVNLLTIFDYLSDEFINARIIDPSNSNNVISDDLTFDEKRTIAQEGLSSRRAPSWDQILW